MEWDSPAVHAGLSQEDEIIALDGIRATAGKMDRIIREKKPGDKWPLR